MATARTITQFTDRTIRSLQSTGKEYWRRGGEGFAVRVSATGSKRFYFIYTVEGRKRFMPLGVGEYPVVTLAMAYKLFAEARAAVAAGGDPLGQAQSASRVSRETPTVSKLVEMFIEETGKDTDKARRYGYALAHLVKAYGKLKATALTDDDVETLVKRMVREGKPSAARKVYATTRVMFKRMKKRVGGHNPCLLVDTKEVVPKDIKRQRCLSEDEIRALWGGLDQAPMGELVRLALKLILVTAQRPGEVVGIHTREIDGDWWNIPVERTKSRRAHRVFLSPLAKDLIAKAVDFIRFDRDLPDEPYVGYIFPTPHLSKDAAITRHSLSKALERTRIEGLEPFRPHDLRRTATTLMAKAGVISEYRERVLNHALDTLDGTYNVHDYDREKQTALGALGRKIQIIIEPGRVDNVVSIAAHR